MPMPRIFVSYSHKDREFVDKIIVRLEKVYSEEYEFFLDKRMPGGEDWWKRIVGEITTCNLFIYLISNHSIQSKYCQQEFTRALEQNKKYLPVRIENDLDLTPLSQDLREKIEQLNWVNMSAGSQDADSFADLQTAIRSALNNNKQSANVTRRSPVVPVKNKSSTDIWVKLTVLFAALSVIATIIAAFIERSPEPTSQATLVGAASTTAIVSPSLTLSPTRTASPTQANTATFTPAFLDVAIQKAQSGVTSNADWQSFIIQKAFAGVPMVLVPKGCFDMGSINGNDDELPLRRRCVEEPFWLDKYEVSNWQFTAKGGIAKYTGEWTNAISPRERVTWSEAQDYCQQKRDGKLPTELQWEFAARGPSSWEYPWGNNFISENVVYINNTNHKPEAIGSRPGGISWVGALDLSGNLWEWVSTIYDQENYPYPYVHDDGREDLSKTSVSHVLRGGSFVNNADETRGANRGSGSSGGQYFTIGFRCVRPLD